MKPKNPLYYTPPGEHRLKFPETGESVEHLFKRLHRLARSYSQQGKYFRVEKRADGVLWWRVEAGENTKLAWWYRLPIDEPFVMHKAAGKGDLLKAQATARYLRRKNRGRFDAKLIESEIIVTRRSMTA